MKEIIRPASHEEWLDIRKSGIGSSEVATIIGFNPFDTPRELWMRKLGMKPPIEENNAMRLGHLLEDAVAQMWAERTGHSIIKRSAIDWIVRDSERPYMQVSPDRTFWVDPHGKRNDANKGILEIKTTQRAVDPDDIPKHWFIQVQYQMGVSGMHTANIAWLTQGRDFGYKEIKFVPSFFEFIVDKVEKFWRDNILGKEEPLPINPADAIDKFPISNGNMREVSQEVYDAYLQLKDIRKRIDGLNEQKESLEEQLKMAILDADGICSGGITLATWKSGKATSKVDTKTLLAENPVLAAKYTVIVNPTRRFLLK